MIEILEKIPKSDSLGECLNNFSDWWLAHGKAGASRFSRLAVALDYGQEGFHENKTLDNLERIVSEHCEALGWCAEWLPDAEGFKQTAYAHSILETAKQFQTGDRKGWLSQTAQKEVSLAKIVDIEKAVMAIERASATLNHRLEALRTIISLEKERWLAEMERLSGVKK